jgi:hypothetical protein
MRLRIAAAIPVECPMDGAPPGTVQAVHEGCWLRCCVAPDSVWGPPSGCTRQYFRSLRDFAWNSGPTQSGVSVSTDQILGAVSNRRVRQQRFTAAGQSMVEFGLVVPILLILFVGIADFGRVFAAGVAVEAATRNAAEALANEYLANPPGGDLSLPAPGIDQTYYDKLRTYAAGVVCAELRHLPNTNYDAGTQTCPDMPVVVFCIHDGADGGCGSVASLGAGVIPPQCGDLSTPPLTNGQSTNGDGTHPRSVELRTCYRFTSVLRLPIYDIGDIWLQRSRTFVIPCYFVLGTTECG